jgi:hypothetical protein
MCRLLFGGNSLGFALYSVVYQLSPENCRSRTVAIGKTTYKRNFLNSDNCASVQTALIVNNGYFLHCQCTVQASAGPESMRSFVGWEFAGPLATVPAEPIDQLLVFQEPHCYYPPCYLCRHILHYYYRCRTSLPRHRHHLLPRRHKHLPPHQIRVLRRWAVPMPTTFPTDGFADKTLQSIGAAIHQSHWLDTRRWW